MERNHKLMSAFYIKKSAILATIILICLGIFQILLILGLPLGHAAWGGAHKVLPIYFRIGSFTSILIYSVAIYVISKRAGICKPPSNSSFARIGTWIFAVYFLLGGPLNVASSSNWERYLMAPLAIILGVLFLLVAKSKTDASIK